MTKVMWALLASLCWSAACWAQDQAEIPLNFDTQVIHIFEVAQTAGDVGNLHPSTPNDHQVLKRILGKFRNHKMMLKNAVYRTDMGTIRLTWADDANIDIVKVAYKTGKDPVLGNSVYADKRQLTDVKIMYRTASNTYDYLHLVNIDDIHHNPMAAVPEPPPVPAKPTFNYAIEGKLTNEQCRFCHILAQNDGSPKGVFFPRYQETYKATPIEAGSLFRSEHPLRLHLHRMPKAWACQRWARIFFIKKSMLAAYTMRKKTRSFPAY